MVSGTESEVGVKQRDKMIVTLSMVWIGIMGLITTPKWIRDARDFVSASTGHDVPEPKITSGGGRADAE